MAGDAPVLFNGVLGPRGDGYVVGESMSADEAEDYHSAQVRSFADDGGGDVVVTAVKGAEDGDGYVVRVYESSGRASSARIELLGRVVEAELGANEIKTFVETRETDLLES